MSRRRDESDLIEHVPGQISIEDVLSEDVETGDDQPVQHDNGD